MNNFVMKHTLALLTAALLAPLSGLPAAEPRPNILHIHADDHRADGARSALSYSRRPISIRSSSAA